MKRLILVMNDLGGVGKTTVTRVLHDYLTRRRVPHLLLSTDGEVDDALPGAEYFDTTDGFGETELIEYLDRSSVVLVDMRSDGGGAEFAEYFLEAELGTLLPELEAAMTIVIPVNEETEGLERVLEAAEAFSDDADYLVVRSPVPAELEGCFDESEAAQALAHLGAVEIEMPSVDEKALDELEGLGYSLPEALANRGQLPRYLVNELKGWELRACAELSGALDLLTPGGTPAAASAPAPRPLGSRRSAARGSRESRSDERAAALTAFEPGAQSDDRESKALSLPS